MTEQTLFPGRAMSRPWWLRAAAVIAGSALAGAAALTITACGGGHAGPTVSSGGGSRPGVVSHAEALHLAGQCIRQHGIPGFPDPTVTGAGQVVISKAQLLAVPKLILAQAMTDCRRALGRAGIQAGLDHGLGGRPAPQQMHAILAFARCLRAHGLTGLADPNPVTGDIRLPPGVGKRSPVVLNAQRACRSLLPGSG
jgi:hypothetical protein